MKKMRFTLLLGAVLLAMAGKAQSTLIHYWHFNAPANAFVVEYLPAIVPIHADYSILDTAKAKIVYMPFAGTSSNYITRYDFNGGDTTNVRLGHAADTSSYSLRLRNPSDSMETRFYMPTTGYKDIKLSFGTEASSAGAGAKTQYFDYSLDSGVTWKTSGMSVFSAFYGTTYPAHDTISASWAKVVVSFDSTVNDNKKFVVRMKFGPVDTGSAGNDRLDNVALDGDSLNAVIIPPPPVVDTDVVIHYWHFNTLASTYNNPGIPPIKADFSLIDVNKALIVYTLDANAPANYSGYIDNVTGTLLNARMAAPAINALRVRNPSDSMSLVFYIPTTKYKNIHLSYATETSSLMSGQLQQLFAYSVDSGATWKTTGLNMVSDSTTANWSLVQLNFGSDTLVNNNPKLMFRIRFAGNTGNASGNDRFDNVVVTGDSLNAHTAVVTLKANNGVCTLYPNPASNSIHINTPAAGSKSITIYNVAGQKVYAAVHTEQVVNLSVAQLKTGMYYVLIHDNMNGTDYTIKFVKQD